MIATCNSVISLEFIDKIVYKYKFDLNTLVVDWNKFKNIQLSFFKASFPNIEDVTNHAFIATLYRISEKYKNKELEEKLG